jgi:hypothetical protein
MFRAISVFLRARTYHVTNYSVHNICDDRKPRPRYIEMERIRSWRILSFGMLRRVLWKAHFVFGVDTGWAPAGRTSSPLLNTFETILKCRDRLCGLVVRVLGYRSGGPGSIPGTQKKKVVCLERGPLSLVSTTEELLDRKVAASV